MKKILLILSILLLSGCYNYKELDDLAIVSAIAIDKNENDKNFKISVQIISTQKQIGSLEGGSNTKFYIYNANGNSIQEGIREIIKKSPRRIYFNHNQLLVISENIAKNDMNAIFDLAARDTESRSDYPIVISKNAPAYKVLETVTTVEDLNAFNIKDSIKVNNEYKGIIEFVTLSKSISDFLNPYKDMALPSIEIKGNIEKNDDSKNLESTKLETFLEIKTMAIFKENNFIEYLNSNDSYGLNLINNTSKHSIITYECEKDKYISLELTNPKTSIEFKNGNAYISLKGKIALAESHCNYKLNNNKDDKFVRDETQKYLKKILISTIENIYYKSNSKSLNINNIMHKYKVDNFKKYYVNVKLELISIGNSLREIE